MNKSDFDQITQLATQIKESSPLQSAAMAEQIKKQVEALHAQLRPFDEMAKMAALANQVQDQWQSVLRIMTLHGSEFQDAIQSFTQFSVDQNKAFEEVNKTLTGGADQVEAVARALEKLSLPYERIREVAKQLQSNQKEFERIADELKRVLESRGPGISTD